MEGFKNFAGAVCVTAALAGFGGMLMPPGKLEKVWKLVLSVFVIVCIVGALNGAKDKFDFGGLRKLLSAEVGSESSLSSRVAAQAAELAETALRDKLARYASDMGYSPVGIDVEFPDGDLGGDCSVTVWLRADDAASADGLRELFRSAYGINADVKLAK